eukprot:TRINITY_DN75403_c0_g1_i3.p1 TRINITY_DN75403_c0_g1~~TRINITY_DN75403_c0_g1_i3.p1  ORF type:complete len:863 (+),score=246.29 TRINITY_DN75403_c0_g1_i3:75-2591(+)
MDESVLFSKEGRILRDTILIALSRGDKDYIRLLIESPELKGRLPSLIGEEVWGKVSSFVKKKEKHQKILPAERGYRVATKASKLRGGLGAHRRGTQPPRHIERPSTAPPSRRTDSSKIRDFPVKEKRRIHSVIPWDLHEKEHTDDLDEQPSQMEAKMCSDGKPPKKVKDVFDAAKMSLGRIQTRLSDWDKMVEMMDSEHEEQEDSFIASESSIVKKDAWSDFANFQKRSSTSQTSPSVARSPFSFSSGTRGKEQFEIKEIREDNDGEERKYQEEEEENGGKLDSSMTTTPSTNSTMRDDDDDDQGDSPYSPEPLDSSISAKEAWSPSLGRIQTRDAGAEDSKRFGLSSPEVHNGADMEWNGKELAQHHGRRSFGGDGVRMISSLLDSGEDEESTSDEEVSFHGEGDESDENHGSPLKESPLKTSMQKHDGSLPRIAVGQMSESRVRWRKPSPSDDDDHGRRMSISQQITASGAVFLVQDVRSLIREVKRSIDLPLTSSLVDPLLDNLLKEVGMIENASDTANHVRHLIQILRHCCDEEERRKMANRCGPLSQKDIVDEKMTKDVVTQERAVSVLQSHFRGVIARSHFKKTKNSVQIIERAYARYQYRRFSRMYRVRNDRLVKLWPIHNGKKSTKTMRWALRFILEVYKKARTGINVPLPEFIFEHIRQMFGTRTIVDEYSGTIIRAVTDPSINYSTFIVLGDFVLFLKEEWPLPVFNIYMRGFNKIFDLLQKSLVQLQRPIVLDATVCHAVVQDVFKDWPSLHPLSNLFLDIVESCEVIARKNPSVLNPWKEKLFALEFTEGYVPAVPVAGLQDFRTTTFIFLHCLADVFLRKVNRKR